MNQRRPPLTLLTAAIVLALAFPGCASMQQRVSQSENRSNTLEAQVADLQSTQQTIIERLTQLREDLEEALDPIRAQQAGGGADLRAMQGDLTMLREQVQLLTDQLTAIAAAEAAAAAAAAADGTTPVNPGFAMPPVGTTPATSGGTTTPGDPSTSGATEPSGAGSDANAEIDEEEALFNSAYSNYTASQFVVAVSGFAEFAARYPDSPRAPDALYWIGESLSAQDRHDEARRRFLEVPSLYPNAAKVPDAVLRAALEAVELGLLDDANRELRQLIEAHPRSDAALIGCLQLDRLGQALPSGCQLP